MKQPDQEQPKALLQAMTTRKRVEKEENPEIESDDDVPPLLF